MSFTIFNSWQSDLPNATNRGFIGTALANVKDALQRDETVTVEPVIDRDTSGVPGSPDIALTIFGKIDGCQLFVGDVSIINHGQGGRKTPNPNVLVELGYALKSLGPERVILVMNTAYGGPEDLPFDLKMRRIVSYNMPQNATERSAERKILEQRLNVAVRAIIEHHEQTAATPVPAGPSLLDRAVEAVGNKSPQQAALIEDYMAELGVRLDQLAPDYDAAERDAVPLDEALVTALDGTKGTVAEFTGLARAIAAADASDAARAAYEGFRHILERYEPRPPQPGQGSVSYRAVAFDFYKFLGHELFVTLFAALIGSRRWTTVGELLAAPIYVGRNRHGEAASLHFSKVSKKIELLEFRKQRTRSNQISLHADLLHTRHTEGELAAVAPANEFEDADYFLYLRSVVETETEDTWQVWLAYSTLYMFSRPPRFLVEAERVGRAQAIADSLGIGDIEVMRQRVQERGGGVQRLFTQAYDLNPLRTIDLSRIGSRT